MLVFSLECFSAEESAKWYVEIKDHHDSTKRIGCDPTFALVRHDCVPRRDPKESLATSCGDGEMR